MKTTLIPVLSAATLLLLAGCAAPQTTDSGSGSDPGTTEEQPTAGGDTCADLEAAGATGASIGPVAIFESREDMLDSIDGQLGVLGATEPPADYADQWSAQETFLEQLKVVVNGLPEGGTLSGATGDIPTDPEAWSFWSDFWFSTCG